MEKLEGLAYFQEWMQQQLLYPEGEMNADGTIKKSAFWVEEMVQDSKRLSARDHLAIYQRSYIARLRDCMCKVFSTLEYALGEELFVAFADTYLEAHPSTNYSLGELGAKFADFLQATRPDADAETREEWPDFMIELARFEFAINVIFDQEDGSKNECATKLSNESDLQLCSVIELFEFSFPIRPFYSAFVNGEQPDLPAKQQTYCAVIRQRKNFRIALYDLQPAQYYFLKQFQITKNVQQALNYLVTEFNMDETKLFTVWEIWKETWISAGFFEDKTLFRQKCRFLMCSKGIVGN